ncbi:MAG: NAD-dependent protein deacylase [Acidipropionibacterium acidipropionici]|jgi:NAD-dependent deacetylase|uniref:NAD-dependent protein deacylase n=1 Tax=Acidipropionibacterium acidipropionici TaxID=1748 RepID=UPI002F3501DD
MDDLASVLAGARRAVFFGGAGVSTESGIPDFRSAGGLYTTAHDLPYPAEYMLSHECFEAEPQLFMDFYRHYLVHPDARPNRAHRALAAMEGQGRLEAVITQNIDGLHQDAGSARVIELHGSVHRNHCMGCGRHYGLDVIMRDAGITVCHACGQMIRPDVVLYGETLDRVVIDDALAAIQAADVLIVGGTSLNVYPAAGMIRFFRGTHLVLINLETTPYDSDADLVIHERIGEALGEALGVE